MTCRLTIFAATCLVGLTAHAAPPLASGPMPNAGDVRDSVLFLGGGPLHVRMHITLGGQSLAETRRTYAERLLKSLDTDGDGKLSRDESAKSPLLRKKQRDSAKEFIKSLGVKEQLVGMREIEQEVERVGGETVVYRQDVSAAGPDQQVFKFLDENSDGVIDAREITAASERLLKKDDDQDQCVSFDEFMPPPPPPDPRGVVSAPPPTPTTTTVDLIRGMGDQFLGRRLIEKYDRDRNRKLSAVELGWNAERFALLDRNQDQLLDASELDAFNTSPVDLELSVDLAPPEGQQPEIRVLTIGAERLDNQDRPDFVKVRFRDAVISLSYRHLDPLAEAMENAMRGFNRFDVDANGYLDMAEVKDRVIWERGLFEQLDADSDGKVFGDELKAFLAVRFEPEATACRLKIYDTGSGFFLSLDRNGDGRISERERRTIPPALAQLNRDGKPGLTYSEPVHHFHLELARNTFQLFKTTEVASAVQTPAFQRRPPIGPSWFQALDRNNDGDVSWEEFLLSSRQEFDHIDADHDGLIAPQEAARADEEYEHTKPQLSHN